VIKGIDPHTNLPKADGKGVNFVGVSVVYFCHDGKGNFLMHKRSKQARDEHGNWDIGAGGLEIQHSVEETLRKEIQEEYNTKVLDFEFLGFRDVFRKHEGETTHWITLDFKVLVDPKTVKNGEPHKFDEVRWIKIGELPSLRHSQVDIFLEKYKHRL
jgi:ADP-ribose pyrophosphatase YjhB (NUDIX family)